MYQATNQLHHKNTSSVFNNDSKKSSSQSQKSYLTDNRSQAVTQRKLVQKMDSFSNNGTFQLVLRNPEDAARNAQLTQRYHDAEDEGDAFSIMSANVAHHQSAINKYTSAITLRQNAGALHTNNDGGHLLAIDTLRDKIAARRDKIRQLQPPQQAPQNQAPYMPNQRVRPPNWFDAPSIGTGSQASWITGDSAWQPRKKGT